MSVCIAGTLTWYTTSLPEENVLHRSELMSAATSVRSTFRLAVPAVSVTSSGVAQVSLVGGGRGGSSVSEMPNTEPVPSEASIT